MCVFPSLALAVVVRRRLCCLFDYVSNLRHAMWELYLPLSAIVIVVVNIPKSQVIFSYYCNNEHKHTHT